MDTIRISFPRVREIIFSITSNGVTNNIPADVSPLREARRRVLSLWEKNCHAFNHALNEHDYTSNWLDAGRKPNFKTMLVDTYEAVNKAVGAIRAQVPVNGLLRGERCILADGTEVPLHSIMRLYLEVAKDMFVPINLRDYA